MSPPDSTSLTGRMTVDGVTERLAGLSDEELARLDNELKVRVPFFPGEPSPIQRAFLLLDPVLDVLYGGAYGPGKSWALLMAALRYTDRPGYGGLLMRATLTELEAEPNGLIPTLGGWLDHTAARWTPRTRTWHFPSGATITFGYLQDPDDHLRYRGPSWHFVGIDQAEEIRPSHLQFMFSRLRRRAGDELPIRYRLTANPGGRAHEFLVRRYRTIERDLDPRSGRAFLPGLIEDNPHLDVASYEEVLSQLGEVEYRRGRWGDWTATVAGQVFLTQHITAIDSPPPGLRLVRAWDLASTAAVSGTDPDWTVGMLLGRAGNSLQDPTPPLEVILDVVRDRVDPAGVDRLMVATAIADGPAVPVVVEQEGRSAGRREIEHIRRSLQTAVPGIRVFGVEPSGSKIERASPAARWVNEGRVGVLAKPWAGPLLAELSQVGVGYHGHDDQMDALALAHRWLDRQQTGRGTGAALAAARVT